MNESKFTGHGAVVDLCEQALYLGNLLDSEKHGFGILKKFRAVKDARVIMDDAYASTRDNFFETIEKWLGQAKTSEAKARKRSAKI